MTWRTRTGLTLMAIGAAALMGDGPGALVMLGAWFFWDEIVARQHKVAWPCRD